MRILGLCVIKFQCYLTYLFTWFGLAWFIRFAWMLKFVDLIWLCGLLIGLLTFRLVWIMRLCLFVGSNDSYWFELKFEVS